VRENERRGINTKINHAPPEDMYQSIPEDMYQSKGAEVNLRKNDIGS
jgi:hypothetical protein